MTVLVDPARWPWRGTHWCHLVSDQSLDELHEFAARLGVRRVGFQGDHYDIDVDTRIRAIELGAQPSNSRELVRRMKAAGLRIRPSSFLKWRLVSRGIGSLPSSVWADVSAPHAHAVRLLVERAEHDRARDAADGWFVLRRAGSVAVVLHGSAGGVVGDGGLAVGDRPADGVFVRIDGDGEWSVECVSPSLSPHE